MLLIFMLANPIALFCCYPYVYFTLLHCPFKTVLNLLSSA